MRSSESAVARRELALHLVTRLLLGHLTKVGVVNQDYPPPGDRSETEDSSRTNAVGTSTNRLSA